MSDGLRTVGPCGLCGGRLVVIPNLFKLPTECHCLGCGGVAKLGKAAKAERIRKAAAELVRLREKGEG